MQAGPWNWLEVAKIAAGLLTPVALALLGIYIHRVTKQFEHSQWRSQKLVEKRLTVYDDTAPLFNDLLCYFTYVGGWRDMDPPAVVAWKRALDKKIHLAAPLFTEDFFRACMGFQELCFSTYGGWGQDALLRTSTKRRRQSRLDWKHEWNSHFAEDVAELHEVQAAYHRVMESFSKDIGVNGDMRR
jgi:hypothetical protein